MNTQTRQDIDPERLRGARETLCSLFNISTLREHQEKAGRNIIQGLNTMYDVPTGGGKTLAFWYPLFYYWKPGDTDFASQKVILVISPLNALMETQAKELSDRGIPAIAVNSLSHADELFEVHGSTESEFRLKYRVIITSPETALTSSFQERLLQTKVFKKGCISIVIDEGHCIAEWGGDFRPHYDAVGKLLARCPSHVPVLVASATMPEDVQSLIREKLDLPTNCAHIAVSNEKLNVALSVRIIQHPVQTFADLLFLFPPLDQVDDHFEFPQTIIYVNRRKEAEGIQDFLRAHLPSSVSPDVFEFYHRTIDEGRKRHIQERLRTGYLRCVIATDALGM
ncbi:P-loop containing nucleoside triphosphate hydrolase protein, partial [Dendrothele bispora CBS 962.96]